QDHADHAERGDGRIDVAQAPCRLQLAERVAKQIDVIPHPLLDLTAGGRRERADFVAERRDGATTGGRDARVPQHALTQPLLGIRDDADRQDDLVADALEAVGHDLEEQRFLAVEVMVEAGLRHPQCARDVADGGGVVAAVAKNLCGGPADLDASRLRGGGQCADGRHAGRLIPRPAAHVNQVARGWRLVTGCWRLAAGDWRLATVWYPPDRPVGSVRPVTSFVGGFTKHVAPDTIFWNRRGVRSESPEILRIDVSE